jgi:hypothetical protein
LANPGFVPVAASIPFSRGAKLLCSKKQKKVEYQHFPFVLVILIMNKRVTGLGGVFFKARDPEAIKRWYEKHLHIDNGEYGAVFKWRHQEEPHNEVVTAWSPFPANTDYYLPSRKEFMFNYRVENLEELLRVLREEGVEIVGEIEKYPYGKFG